MGNSLLLSIYNVDIMFDSENYKKEWYKNNREIVLKKARYYRETHKDEIAKIKHICYERKKQEISNSGKKYYLKIRNNLFDILGGGECKNCWFYI